MKDKVVIVGAGEVGSHVAALLAGSGREVVVIEQRVEVESPVSVTLVTGDATDPEVLEAAGLAEASVVAAVTGSDEVNLTVASLARFHYGVGRTVARINVPGHAWLFAPELGVDVALNQAEVLSRLIEAQAPPPPGSPAAGPGRP